MVVVGIDAVVRHHTRAAALMLTGTDNDLVGRLFPALFVAASQEGVDAFLRQVVAVPTEATPMEATCCLVHGDERFIEMTAVNLMDSPEVDGLVISLANRTDAHRALDVANRKADYDALTGLLNRRAFEEHVRGFFKDGVARPAFLAMFDVDDLKSFNDHVRAHDGRPGAAIGWRAIVSDDRKRRAHCTHRWRRICSGIS